MRTDPGSGSLDGPFGWGHVWRENFILSLLLEMFSLESSHSAPLLPSKFWPGRKKAFSKEVQKKVQRDRKNANLLQPSKVPNVSCCQGK